MTIEERAHKIWFSAYREQDVELELTQFFSEIKKRCMEECERTVSTPPDIDGYCSIRPRSPKEISQAIDRLEVE